HLGHFLLTSLLRERIVASAPSRIVVVSSDAHKSARAGLDFDDLMAEKRYKTIEVYARSKLANILFATELARRLEGTGVTVNALHPGVVRSGFAGGDDVKGLLWRIAGVVMRPFMLSSERGAETSIYVACSPELDGKTGGYYAKCRAAQCTAAAQ